MSDVQLLLSVKIKNYSKAELLKYATNLQSSLKDSIMKQDEPKDPEIDMIQEFYSFSTNKKPVIY